MIDLQETPTPLHRGVEQDTQADGSRWGTAGGAVGNTAVDVAAFAKHSLSSWLLFLFFFFKATFYNLLSMLCTVGFEASMHVESPRPQCLSVNSLWRAHHGGGSRPSSRKMTANVAFVPSCFRTSRAACRASVRGPAPRFCLLFKPSPASVVSILSLQEYLPHTCALLQINCELAVGMAYPCLPLKYVSVLSVSEPGLCNIFLHSMHLLFKFPL